MKNEEFATALLKKNDVNEEITIPHSSFLIPHFSHLIPHSPFPIALFSFLLITWGFFQFWYPYHFFYQEQNQLFLWSWDYVSTYFEKPGGTAWLIGDFLTQFYYYLYAGAAILSVCLALIGTAVYRALRNFKAGRFIATAVAIALMSFVAICHFSTAYHLGSTISILGWASALWTVSRLFRARRRTTALFAIVITGAAAWLLFGMPQIKRLKGPDLILEKNFAIDNEYYFGNYERVEEMVRTSESWNDQMLFFYNLIQAQRGQLADHLMDFTPNYLGTFDKIGPDTPRLTIINMNELYWLLGDMTFTERAAMMTNVFAPDNRNVRMVKRLAECNIVSGDSLAAEKYLRLLDKTLAYRQWAQNVRQHGKEIYAQKARLVNHHDTITTSDNAHFLMMQLLDAHPDNGIALDYILCSDLLLKDINSFKRDYDRYATGDDLPDRDVLLHRIHTTKLYQEALCIWLAGTNAPPEEWQRIHRQDVLQQFREYNAQRGHPRFKGTYWYYFDKFKGKI